MLLLDTLLRFPTIVGLLFFGVLLLRDEKWSLITRIGFSLAISLSALFLSNAPLALALPEIPYKISLIIAAPNLALLWWFGRSLLDDNFQLGAVEWIGFLLLSLNNLPFLMELLGGHANWVNVGLNALSLAVPAHLTFLAIAGWRDDLVRKRRTFRLLLLLWLIAGLAVILILEDSGASEPVKSLIRLALTFPAIWYLIITSTRMQAPFGLSAQTPEQLRQNANDPALERLMHLIEVDQIYLDASLSLTTLAKTCGLSEYQLRNLINGHLGYANFPAFLNVYRIGEARQRLAQTDEPITNIALDCGYKTLSTFNRAFLRIAGVTPTAYRQTSVKT